MNEHPFGCRNNALSFIVVSQTGRVSRDDTPVWLSIKV